MNKNSVFWGKMEICKKRLALLVVMLVTSSAISAEKLPLPDLIPHLSLFRQSASVAPSIAFEYYTDASGMKKLTELGGVLCPDTDSVKGWQYFFGTSVATVSSLNEETVLAMFYNPWSDVALLCQWNFINGRPRISDAQLLVGDILRETKEPVLTPLWRRVGDVPPALSAMVAANDTVKGFMDIYGKPSIWKSGDWRGKLKSLKKDEQVLGNRQAVGFMFTEALVSVNVFFTEDVFKPLKSSMENIRQMLLKGQTSKVLAIASETSIESQKILTEVPFDWKKATMVSLVTDPKNAFVFLADYANPEYFACFWFAMSDDSKVASLKRIDFLGHTLSFEQVDELARQAGMQR